MQFQSAAFQPFPIREIGGGPFGDFGEAFEALFLSKHRGYEAIRPAGPLVMSRSYVDELCRATETALAVVQQRVAQQGSSILGELGYSIADQMWLAPMVQAQTLERAGVFARADFVMGVDGPRLVELNVGPTIGGIGTLDRYCDALTEYLRPTLHEPLARAISMPRPVQSWSRALKRLAGSGQEDSLRIALVVADEEYEVPHPHEAALFLNRAQISAEVMTVDVAKGLISGESNRLLSPNIIYGCFTFDQFANPRYRAFVERMLEWQASGGPLYMSPPICTVLGNKEMLSFCSRLTGALSVARTVRLSPNNQPKAISNKDGFVLKPASGYGGNGVVIGARCSLAQWEQSLNRALLSDRPHVLQDYVSPVDIVVPTGDRNTRYEVGIGCLWFDGSLAGILLRHVPSGSDATTNCSQGATFSSAIVVDDHLLEIFR